MIKVLHIISDLKRGGRERQLAVLVNSSDNDIQHKIAVLNESTDSYIDEYNLNDIDYLGRKKSGRIKNIISLAKKYKIDVIHTWGNNETIYAIPAAKILKIPLLNGSVRHGIRLNSFAHIFRSYTLRISKFVLANSKAGLLANRIKIDNTRHFILYNGIEKKFFVEKNNKKRDEFIIEKEISKDSIIFLSIMNFIPFKDYITPLKVLRSLKDEGLSFFYILIGKGKREEEIKELIINLNLEKNTAIISNNSIQEFTSIADILIHSSLGEGCSNAILEAKAGGLIVVASNTGGTKEIISENDFLFEYQNQKDLEFKVISAVEKIKKNKSIKKIIQKATMNNFSSEKFCDNYLNIIKKIT